MDVGREWICSYAKERPALAAALVDDASAQSVRKRAKRTVCKWRAACEWRVGELRRTQAIRAQMSMSHLHRLATDTMRALITKHDTFATFLSEPLDGLQRWQMFIILVTAVFSHLLVNIWMCVERRIARAASVPDARAAAARYYAKAVDCCAELKLILDSGPDGGDCPPVGPCRGFAGDCADLPDQFAALPVPPDYPDGLADYTCHAFPDDDNQVDSFLVGLISIAVALPVSSFIAQCFGIANDSEAPESLLEWSGWPKLLLGPRAHRRWLYTGPAGPPLRFIKWYVRSVSAPQPETLINLWHSLRCWLTGAELPWVTEWREAQEEAAAAEAGEGCSYDAAKDACGSEGGKTSSSVRSAQSLSTYKRTVMLAGFIGTYITWAVFAWFIFVRFVSVARIAAHAARASDRATCPLLLHRQAYGMLIYKLLGDEAESQFARSWGISYGMNAATEWKDIAVQAVKMSIVLIILERLFITSNSSWLEVWRGVGTQLLRALRHAHKIACLGGAHTCARACAETGAHGLPQHRAPCAPRGQELRSRSGADACVRAARPLAASAAVQARRAEHVPADAPLPAAHEAPVVAVARRLQTCARRRRLFAGAGWYNATLPTLAS